MKSPSSNNGDRRFSGTKRVIGAESWPNVVAALASNIHAQPRGIRGPNNDGQARARTFEKAPLGPSPAPSVVRHLDCANEVQSNADVALVFNLIVRSISLCRRPKASEYGL